MALARITALLILTALPIGAVAQPAVPLGTPAPTLAAPPSPSVLSPPPQPLGAITATPVAQPAPPATGGGSPTSTRASNITPGDTTSEIAPRLPAPALGDDSPPEAFLRAARDALTAGRTGEAQEALERAESRALTRSVAITSASQPSGQPLIKQIAAARDALSAGDKPGAIKLIDAAMHSPAAQAPSK